MASRRDLKKVIAFITDELAAQAFVVSCDKQCDAESWVAVFNKIIALSKDYTARVSHVEPGMPAKKYFNALCDSFNADAMAILDDIKAM